MFLVGPVLLLIWIFCVMFIFIFYFFFVSNVPSVSELSILDFPFGILWRNICFVYSELKTTYSYGISSLYNALFLSEPDVSEILNMIYKTNILPLR